MSSQLDILALEPFYGGARKAMLDTILRHSRHRWTLLKLPPRRIERRLAAASVWFAEQLSRHWAGRLDLLFTSEAMNLADLFHLMPALAKKPAVVYFHDNQLPAPNAQSDGPLDVINISTATAATEIWFNSLYHLRSFLVRATALVQRHPEMAGRNPLPVINAKTQLMPPPVDMAQLRRVGGEERIQRDPRTFFIDTRDANLELINAGLLGLARRGEKYNLITVGPAAGLSDEIPRRTISEKDELEQFRALHQAAVMISARPGAAADHYAVRGLAVGCWPVFPDAGVYPELIPSSLHPLCLYDGSTTSVLVNRLQNVWWIQRPDHYEDELEGILRQFEAVEACRAIDERLEQLAVIHSLST